MGKRRENILEILFSVRNDTRGNPASSQYRIQCKLNICVEESRLSGEIKALK